MACTSSVGTRRHRHLPAAHPILPQSSPLQTLRRPLGPALPLTLPLMILAALAAPLLLSLAASPANATVEVPTVIIRPELPHRALTEGEEFALPVDVYVKEDAALPSVGLRSDAPSALLTLDVEPAVRKSGVAPGYRHERHTLRGRLEPGLDRVRVQVTVDGVVYEEAIRLRGLGDAWAEDTELDVALARGAAPGGASVDGAALDSTPLDPTAFSRPDPVPSGFPTPEPTLAKAARTVNVRGQIFTRILDSGDFRGVDGVTVYFMQVRGLLDDLELGSTTTDVNGNFDFDVTMDGVHDVYLKVRAINSVVNVGTDAGFQTYGRNFGLIRDFAGTSIDVGGRRFAGDMNHALWLASTLTRSQRWYADRGYVLPSVNCRWRDDVLQSSCYLPILGMEGIHLRSSATWNASTVVHEYGHHFVAASPVKEVWPPFYTNGVCDPGHCGTCPENEAVAWSEGLPYFLQQEINADHADVYGWAQPGAEGFETVGACVENGIFGENPQSTEDFLAALCNDIIDSNPDGSALAPGITENLDLSVDDVLFVASTMSGSNSLQFVDAFRAYLQNPAFSDRDRLEFWAAAAINGFANDTTPPTAPVIGVPTHPLGTPSASNLPFVSFTGATDDDSGVDRYRVSIDPAPGAPSASALLVEEDFIAWPTTIAEGTWYVNATTLDRAGNESTSASREIIVGPSTPLDLAPWAPGLWEDHFLVRHDTSVTAATGAVEPTLIGGQDFWVSLSSRNESVSSGAITPFNNYVLVNGEVLTAGPFSDTLMGSLEEYQVLNAGPTNLPGGRHHFGILLDGNQVVAESDNENNRFDRYLVFRPSVLAAGAWETFPAPPRAYTTGSFGFQAHPNVSGHRVQSVNVFGGVMMAPVASRDDYSLRFHNDISTGADNGFETPRTISDNDEGRTEVVIYNTDALGRTSFDVGVERRTSIIASDYRIRHVGSQALAPGADVTLNWAADDEMSLLEYAFNVFTLPRITIQVEVTFDPAEVYRTVELYWMDSSEQVLRPHLQEPDAVVDEDGRAYLNLAVSSNATHCLVVVRDTSPDAVTPGGAGGAAGKAHTPDPLPLTIRVDTINSSTVDLTVLRENAGWDLPFLPSIEPAQIPDLSVPDELVGGGFGTYLNYAIANLGRASTVQDVVVIADLDGVVGQQFFYSQTGTLAGESSLQVLGTNPVFVEGGRHTMTLQIDPFDQITEANENNNTLSVQFGWKGPDLVPFSNVSMPAPPDPEGGFEAFEQFTVPGGLDGEEPTEIPVNVAGLNSHGFRIPAPLQKNAHAIWRGVATMPTANVDVDVRLHEVVPPVRAFTTALARSSFGMGESDFVLIDGRATENLPYDVSVVRAEGNDGYTLVQLDAFPLGQLANGSGVFGTFGMDAGGFLSLHELDLEPGTYTIELTPSSGTADLGLSVFFPTRPLQQPYASKDDGRDDQPMSDEFPGGQAEKVEFEVRPGEEGTFCLAVWKARAEDLQENVDYLIQVFGNPAAAECVRIDGRADDAAYGAPLSVQTTQTQFGDNTAGVVDFANGSELDQAFARVCDGVLYLTFAGNLESNYNDLEIFIDSRPGGQNRLRGDNADFGGQVDLNRMGDDGSGNGLRFHPLFEPDWWFGVQGGYAEVTTGMPYKLAAYQAELLTSGGGDGWSLGFTTAPSRGLLEGIGTDNPHGVRVAIDNSNIAGVDAGTGGSSGQLVETGVELAIPLAAIGSPTDCLRIVAFVNGRSHDLVSNQVLPPLPVGTGNLGDPRSVDFSFVGDRHWFTVCQGASTDIGDEVPGPVAREITLHQPAPNPFNPRTLVAFELPRSTDVDLALYDLAGRRVRTLVAGSTLAAGRHEKVWDGTDEGGRRVASGAYLVRLVAGGEQQVRRVMLLK